MDSIVDKVNLKHSLIRERACDSITLKIYVRCEMKQESTSKDILIKKREQDA
jgi:hypothetical protein